MKHKNETFYKLKVTIFFLGTKKIEKTTFKK